MKKSQTISLILLYSAFMILLTACGQTNYDPDDQQAPAGDTQALHIFTPFRDSHRVGAAGDALRETMAAQDINLHIEITSYLDDERDTYHALLLSKFAAGVGPDIFLRDGFPLFPFIENEFLADIYGLIDQYANRSDFFTNALEGVEIDGRLYMLPLQFGFDYIGINTSVPQEFTNRFVALDRVSPSDMIEIYFDLINEHPEFSEMAFIHNFSLRAAFVPEINRLVDFGGRTADFAPLHGLLADMRTAFEGNDRFDTPFVFQSTMESMALEQERYVFSRAAFEFDALFPYQEPFFMHYIPLADESGRLVNRAWGVDLSVASTADKPLAWAFIEELISVTAAEDISINMPTARNYFRESLQTSFGFWMTQIVPRPLTVGEGVAVEQAIARIEEHSTWPTVTPVLGAFIPAGVFMDVLDDPTDIVSWLNEERQIEPFVYVAAEELPDLPLRTLTIINDNRHTAVIQQAAAAMNASWRERNEPYLFHIEIDDHDWTDWEGAEGRMTRLQAAMMAGQGPDMIIVDGHNVRAFASAGFLQDFYALIDQCPVTSRDDFFFQALAAFENNNRLNMFPMSFGFEYVAVNAGLPQPFIDRFTQKSAITMQEMMEFYLDLMEAHGDEIGHLTFDTGSTVTSSGSTVQAAVGSFVDFNARRAYLTDPGFIDFLELAARVYDGWDVASTWGTTINDISFLTDRAREYVFMIESDGLSAFNAFFTADPPIFLHHIPLVDDSGRMLVQHEWGPVWAAVCITARADGPLAWELVRYMIHAYTEPVGRAAVDPVFGAPARWGRQSLSTPILRSLFRDHALTTFESTYETFGDHGLQRFVGFEDIAGRGRQFEAAVNRLAGYAERPMGMLSPMVPDLFWEDFHNFLLGLVTAEEAAQSMQNSVALWLIE